MHNCIKTAASIALGIFAAFYNQYGLFVILVSAAVVIDFTTGIIKAKVLDIGLDSKIARKGFWKKISLFAALFFGIFLDFITVNLLSQLNIKFGLNSPFSLIIASYIVINESISIAENLYQINPNSLPPWITKLLKVAKSDLSETQ